MKIYDRSGKYIDEKEYHAGLLTFLYKTIPGRVVLKKVVNPAFSIKRGYYYNSRKSKKDIVPFAKKNNIDLSHWNIEEFNNFNEFFRRKKEVKVECNDLELPAIADSKLSVYNIDEDLILKVKNSVYSVEDIVGNKTLASKYKNGTCLVFRLGVDDYHRYIYLDSGELINKYKIDGELHTVRSISEKYNVFSRNNREVSIIKTCHFGEIVQIEVGALLVGAIKNEPHRIFIKGQEKGYFEYGGSTIVLLFKEGAVSIDRDIVEQSMLGIETKVSIGEKIGVKC